MDWYRSVRVPVKASKKRRWVFIIMDCMGKQKGAGNELSEVLAGFIILVFYLSITWSLIPPCAPDVHRKCAEICENKSQMRRADSHSTPLHSTALHTWQETGNRTTWREVQQQHDAFPLLSLLLIATHVRSPQMFPCNSPPSLLNPLQNRKTSA